MANAATLRRRGNIKRTNLPWFAPVSRSKVLLSSLGPAPTCVSRNLLFSLLFSANITRNGRHGSSQHSQASSGRHRHGRVGCREAQHSCGQGLLQGCESFIVVCYDLLWRTDASAGRVLQFLAGVMLSFGGLLSEVIQAGSAGINASNPGLVKVLGGFVFPVGLVM